MREAALEAAQNEQAEPLEMALEEPELAQDQQANGQIPPVSDATSATQSASASELAFDNPEVATQDVKDSLEELCTNRFEGDLRKAFDHFDGDTDGGLSHTELSHMLHAAGVDSARSIATAAIGADTLAMDYDSTIEWDAFHSMFAT